MIVELEETCICPLELLNSSVEFEGIGSKLGTNGTLLENEVEESGCRLELPNHYRIVFTSLYPSLFTFIALIVI